MTSFDKYLIHNYGYEKAVIIQELITWTTGILFGIILGILFTSFIVLNIRIDYDMQSPTVIKMNKNRNKCVIVNPKTILQLLEVYYITLAWMLSREQDEIKLDASDIKRIRWIIITIFVISSILICIGLYLSIDIMTIGI